MEIQRAIEKLNKHKKWGFVDDTADAMELAIEALQKQIPGKPTIKQLGDDIEVTCPVCGHCHIFMAAKKGDNYCSNCGKKFDWGRNNGKSRP